MRCGFDLFVCVIGFCLFLELEERREDLSKDLDKFNVIINEVEKLHEQGISVVFSYCCPCI